MKNEKGFSQEEKKHIAAIRVLSQRHRAAVLFVARSFLMAEARTKRQPSKR